MLLSSGHRNFDVGARSRQFRNANCCAGGPRLFKDPGINSVHALKQIHVRKIDLDRHDIRVVHFIRMQNLSDVRKALLNFVLETLWHFLRFRIRARLARNI